jgi:hypothetical protein
VGLANFARDIQAKPQTAIGIDDLMVQATLASAARVCQLRPTLT